MEIPRTARLQGCSDHDNLPLPAAAHGACFLRIVSSMSINVSASDSDDGAGGEGGGESTARIAAASWMR